MNMTVGSGHEPLVSVNSAPWGSVQGTNPVPEVS